MKGSRSKLLLALTLVLATLLVVSNLWWLSVSIDDALTQTYSNAERETADFALKQALTLLPVAFAAQDREGFLAATEQRLRTVGPEVGGYAPGDERSEEGRFGLGRPFEKDGCVWLGTLGFRFDEDGALEHVSRRINTGEADPCFPSATQ